MSPKRALFGPRVKGFTLIELMIAMVLGLLVIAGAIVLFITTQNASRDAQALSRVQENIRFASDYLVRDVRNAGFRDEASLTWDEWDSIGQGFIDLRASTASDPCTNALVVRYAGRGDCNSAFSPDQISIVQNCYRVVNGVLQCNGEPLVSGVNALWASGILPDGNLDTSTTWSPQWIGVVLGFEFDGGGLGNPNRVVELRAIFRNRLLEHLFPE